MSKSYAMCPDCARSSASDAARCGSNGSTRSGARSARRRSTMIRSFLSRRYASALEEGKTRVGMLQHGLFHGASEPVEGAVQPHARAIAGNVPATRLPLDRLPQAPGEAHIVPEITRARGDEGREREEPALDRIQGRGVGWHRRAPQPLRGDGEAREPRRGRAVRRPTPGEALLDIRRLEGAPQGVLVPREAAPALRRGRDEWLRARNGQQQPQAHERPGDGARDLPAAWVQQASHTERYAHDGSGGLMWADPQVRRCDEDLPQEE